MDESPWCMTIPPSRWPLPGSLDTYDARVLASAITLAKATARLTIAASMGGQNTLSISTSPDVFIFAHAYDSTTRIPFKDRSRIAVILSRVVGFDELISLADRMLTPLRKVD